MPSGARVARWQLPAPPVGALNGWALAFSPDNATLPAGGGARLQTLSFSGDGSMLAAATSRGEVHLWKLSTLRAHLKELGLDW